MLSISINFTDDGTKMKKYVNKHLKKKLNSECTSKSLNISKYISN